MRRTARKWADAGVLRTRWASPSSQLCTLRWRGHFLRDMAGVPSAAIEALAEQTGLLSLALAASLRGYPASEDTRLDHHERIRRHLGFTRCGAAERGRLLDHMTATAQAVPRAATLYPLACRWLLAAGCWSSASPVPASARSATSWPAPASRRLPPPSTPSPPT